MSDIDLGRFAGVVSRWLWLIILAVVLASGVSFVASTFMPRIYLSSITLLVGDEAANPRLSAEDISVSQRAALTFAGMARRQPVLQSTVDALRLPLSWRQLQTRVVVVRPEGSQFLEIRVTDTEPQRAQAIAGEIARQLILQSPTAKDLDQQEQRRQFIRDQVDKLQADIQQAEITMAEKQAALKKEVSARGVLDLQDEIKALDAKITTWRNAYATLLSSGDVNKPNTLSVIEPAFAASDPTSPNIPANVLLAAALGLLLAFGAILLIEYRVNNDALRTTGDVRRAVGTAPLGALPHLGMRTPAAALTLANDPHSEMGEAYRVLRTSIQFVYGEGVVLVTSPGLREGKSIISASLAMSFAQAGKRTVLVDADLRNPSLHKLFGLPNEQGLTSLLVTEPPAVEKHAVDDASNEPQTGRPTAPGYLRRTDVPGLALLSAGPISAVHPGDLLGSTRMRRLVETLLSAADVVIVDCPPVLPVADTAILASIGGAVVLVAEAGRTRGRALAQAKELLLRAQARVLGVVLNKAREGAVGYHGYGHGVTTSAATVGKPSGARQGNAGADLVAQGPR